MCKKSHSYIRLKVATQLAPEDFIVEPALQLMWQTIYNEFLSTRGERYIKHLKQVKYGSAKRCLWGFKIKLWIELLV